MRQPDSYYYEQACERYERPKRDDPDEMLVIPIKCEIEYSQEYNGAWINNACVFVPDPKPGMEVYRAWYTTGDEAPTFKCYAPIFFRTFQAEDLTHALEQAENATEDNEVCLGVAPVEQEEQ